MENTCESRSNGELSSEEVKPEGLTEFFIQVPDGQSSSTEKATESLIQASEQGSISGVEEQNMFVVNISEEHQPAEKSENVQSDFFSEVDTHTEDEQDEPKGVGFRRLFNFKPHRKNSEEIKCSSAQETVLPASDEKRAHSSPSPWPKLVRRATLTFERLRAGTPESMISVLQRFRAKTSRSPSPDRQKGNRELPPRSPVRTSKRAETMGPVRTSTRPEKLVSPTLKRLRALRKKLNTMGRQAGNRMERLQGSSSLSPSEHRRSHAGVGQTESRQGRLHSSLERWRAELQRPPNWLREHILRRRNRYSEDLQRANTDQLPTQEPTSPALSRSPPQSPQSSHGSQRNISRRQQEMELEIVEHSMKMDEILRLPMIIYQPQVDKPSKNCVVCTEDFEPGETLRVLTCFHYFHQGCIDEWLLNYCPWDNLICPICKTMQYSFLDPGFGNEGAQEARKQ